MTAGENPEGQELEDLLRVVNVRCNGQRKRTFPLFGDKGFVSAQKSVLVRSDGLNFRNVIRI